MAAAALQCAAVDEFRELLRQQRVVGSLRIAKHTAQVIGILVREAQPKSAMGLLTMVRRAGDRLAAEVPQEVAVPNIVLRILSIIRNECSFGSQNREAADMMQKLLDADQGAQLTQVLSNDVKEAICALIAELVGEIDVVRINVAEHARDHIHANEVILTYGNSSSVFHFLKEAARHRTFQVIVAETGPDLEGHQMAKNLADAGINTTLIPDAAVFAMMARVNKVIIGTRGVLADGGLIAQTGAFNISVAAKHLSVPLVVITGIYKLCPRYAFSQDTINEHNRPSDILRFDQSYSTSVHVYNPAFDYIPPQYVTVFVTDVGSYNPSYIYRLLAESYNLEEHLLE